MLAANCYQLFLNVTNVSQARLSFVFFRSCTVSTAAAASEGGKMEVQQAHVEWPT